MNCIEYRTMSICEKDKVKVMIGISIFIGQIKEIDQYNNIILEDIMGNETMFKIKNAKFVTKISDELYEKYLKKYQQKE